MRHSTLLLREPGEAGSSAPIPCFQCGICCERWQPLLDPSEVRRVAADLGMSVRTFSRRFTRRYPIRRGHRQVITNEQGGCIFLKDLACSIYEQRPQICREWQAGLDKRECLEGMRRLEPDGGAATGPSRAASGTSGRRSGNAAPGEAP